MYSGLCCSFVGRKEVEFVIQTNHLARYSLTKVLLLLLSSHEREVECELRIKQDWTDISKVGQDRSLSSVLSHEAFETFSKRTHSPCNNLALVFRIQLPARVFLNEHACILIHANL